MRMLRLAVLAVLPVGAVALRSIVNHKQTLGLITSAAARNAASTPRAAAADDDEKKDKLGAGGQGGHAVPESASNQMSEEEQAIQARVMEHQSNAARLTSAEEARSLIHYSTGFAVLSTLSKSLPGFPSGSVVGYALDDAGLPLFCFSGMSGHTQDLLEDPDNSAASLTVTAKGFQGAADGRVTLLGRVRRCAADEAAPLREIYRAKHPNAFWVDFGDFSWFRMHSLEAVRYVGGFARAGKVTAEEYLEASVDPIQAFATPVMSHMNDDHASSTVAIVQHYTGLPGVESATLVGMDRLGLTAECERLGQRFKLRVPFPRAAEDRGDVKKLIVEMTQAAS